VKPHVLDDKNIIIPRGRRTGKACPMAFFYSDQNKRGAFATPAEACSEI
jgi:hypothetical protein